MKKLVLKTAFITLGIALILAVSVFGIVSLSAPYAMMQFTASLGLDTISGDYAYQEYERSGDIGCLARSFLIAAEKKNYRTAEERFELLLGEEGFEAYCAETTVTAYEGMADCSYRDYLMGRGACVYYHLAETEEESAEAISFAIAETDGDFPAGNPVVALAAEAAYDEDAAFCELLLAALKDADFEDNALYETIVKILEGVQ